MMRIRLERAEICFRRKSLFLPLSIELSSGHLYAVTGANGSGKTSLIRTIAAQRRPDSGEIHFEISGKKIDPEDVYRFVSWSGPYLEFPAELSLRDLLQQHFWFRKTLPGLKPGDIPELLDFAKDLHKPVGLFSSGMLHRLKTGLAIVTDSSALLLDEPTANLDSANASKILNLLNAYRGDRITVIASNIKEEYAGADQIVELQKSSG